MVNIVNTNIDIDIDSFYDILAQIIIQNEEEVAVETFNINTKDEGEDNEHSIPEM